jgi:hypothetical protein
LATWLTVPALIRRPSPGSKAPQPCGSKARAGNGRGSCGGRGHPPVIGSDDRARTARPYLLGPRSLRTGREPGSTGSASRPPSSSTPARGKMDTTNPSTASGTTSC